MERNFNTDNHFERLLREKSDEFKMYPSKRVWHSVYNNLHPGRRWPSVTMSITLIASLLLVGYLNTDSTRQDMNNTAISKTTGYTENSHQFFASALNSLNLIPDNNNNALLPVSSTNNSLKVTKGDIQSNSIKGATNKIAGNNKFVISAKPSFRKLINTKDISHSIASNVPAGFNQSANNISAVSHNHLNDNLANKNVRANQVASVNIVSAEPAIETISQELGKEIDDKSAINAGITEKDLQNNVSALKVNTTVDKTGQIIDVAGKNDNLSDNLNDGKEQEAAKGTANGSEIYKTATAGLTPAQKDWIENYALYNRPAPKKWKGKLARQTYFTPSVVYRSLNTSGTEKLVLRDNATLLIVSPDANQSVEHAPFIGFEIGTAYKYNLLKKVKISAGLQLNYTSYKVHAFENGHPIATSLTLIDSKTNLPYDIYRSTPYSNKYGLTSVNLYNQTFQFSVPLGIDFKVAGTDDIEWYAGATIQPTILLGGKSYMISSDRQSYVKATSFLNTFNMNAGFETFVTYKTGNGLTWQAGPQIRTQLFTTNSKEYSVREKLVSYGIKIGVIKTL